VGLGFKIIVVRIEMRPIAIGQFKQFLKDVAGLVAALLATINVT
jgi:hypothetical protein